MDNGNFLFQMLVPLNLGFFALVFLGVYAYEKRLKYMKWLGIAYACGSIASMLDLSTPYSAAPLINGSDFANILYWSVGIFVTIAMAGRFRKPLPLRSIIIVWSAAVLCQYYFGFLNYQFAVQEILANIWAAVFIFMAARLMWSASNQGIERLVRMIFLAIAASYLLRVSSIFLVGWNAAQSDLVQLHGAVQLFASAITANAGALALLVMGALDIVNIYRDESYTDALTNINNRRGFEKYIDQMRQEEGLDGYSLLLCDLDRFKDINDNFGHDVGDQVLCRVSKCLDDLSGHLGVAARIGGEEFAILLKPQAKDAIPMIAEHLRLAISNLQHPELDGTARTTCSFGIARFDGDEVYKYVYSRADKALYEAKGDGRNRVVEFTSPSNKRKAKR